jgi:hypothetical protein
LKGEVLTAAMDVSGGMVAKFGGDGTTLINSAIVDVSGNVGIGRTTPGSRLTVGDGTQNDAVPVLINSFNTNPTTELRMSRGVGAFRGPILAFGATTNDTGPVISQVATIFGFKENATQGNTAGNLRFSVNDVARLWSHQSQS